MHKKRRTSVYLTESTREWVILRAKEKGMSRSCLIYTLIKQAMYDEGYIDKLGWPGPGIVYSSLRP